MYEIKLESTPIRPIASVLKDKIPVPQHFCKTCQRLQEDYKCDCYNRPVKPTENRCFNHTHYAPITAVFKPVPEEQLLDVSA